MSKLICKKRKKGSKLIISAGNSKEDDFFEVFELFK